MNLDFFGIFSVDALYIILGMAGVTLVSIILSIIALCKLGKMKKKYNAFMEGEEGKSLENLILSRFEQVDKIQAENDICNKNIQKIFNTMEHTYQKIGIVKYDAFNEMGGKLSFSLAMLDACNNGYVINAMHSREGCYTYIKEVVKGQSYIELGEEEKIALDKALAGQGDVDLGELNNKLKL